jgi:hypothetical protein
VAENRGDEVLSVVTSKSLIMHIASTDGIPDGVKGKSHGQTVYPALLPSPRLECTTLPKTLFPVEDLVGHLVGLRIRW